MKNQKKSLFHDRMFFFLNLQDIKKISAKGGIFEFRFKVKLIGIDGESKKFM